MPPVSSEVAFSDKIKMLTKYTHDLEDAILELKLIMGRYRKDSNKENR